MVSRANLMALPSAAPTQIGNVSRRPSCRTKTTILVSVLASSRMRSLATEACGPPKTTGAPVRRARRAGPRTPPCQVRRRPVMTGVGPHAHESGPARRVAGHLLLERDSPATELLGRELGCGGCRPCHEVRDAQTPHRQLAVVVPPSHDELVAAAAGAAAARSATTARGDGLAQAVHCERGELARDVRRGAVGAGNLLLTADELLEVRLALHADVLVDRHERDPSSTHRSRFRHRGAEKHYSFTRSACRSVSARRQAYFWRDHTASIYYFPY